MTVFLAIAATFGLALVLLPDVFASDPTVAELVQVIETKPARHRKLMALKQLSDINSYAARAAIVALAEEGDEVTALAAISTMSRDDRSGFRSALEGIVDDDDRSDAVRCAALGACMKHRKDDQRNWSQVRSWVRARTSGESGLDSFSRAYAKHLWGDEVSDE